MKQYLLEDFTAVDGKDILLPTRAILELEDVFEAMDRAKRDGLKIRIQELVPAKTVVDWTQP